jgi:ATP-dependent Clp protease ATP-binding subunit ClpC
LLHTYVQADTARAIVDSTQSRKARQDEPKDHPFSAEAKRVFETALMESRRMGMSFIAPEHIFLALLNASADDIEQLMTALGLQAPVLQTEALRRLKGEAEGEGTRRRVAVSLSGYVTHMKWVFQA